MTLKLDFKIEEPTKDDDILGHAKIAAALKPTGIRQVSKCFWSLRADFFCLEVEPYVQSGNR